MYAKEVENGHFTYFPKTQLLWIAHMPVLSLVCSLNECFIFGSTVQSISGIGLRGLFDLIFWMQSLCFQ